MSYIAGDQLSVTPGQEVHPECRRTYCHPNTQRTDKDANGTISSPKTRRSYGDKFDLESKCLFCGTNAKLKPNKRGEDVYQ